MTIGDRLRDEKIEYAIDRKAAKILPLPSDQNRIIKQAKFTYSPLGKALEKQTRTIEDQGRKQIEDLKVLKTDV